MVAVVLWFLSGFVPLDPEAEQNQVLLWCLRFILERVRVSGKGRRKGKERTRLSAECGALQLRVRGLGLLNHPGAPQIRFLSKEKRGLRCCR